MKGCQVLNNASLSQLPDFSQPPVIEVETPKACRIRVGHLFACIGFKKSEDKASPVVKNSYQTIDCIEQLWVNCGTYV